jgi:hypothetical protein
MGPARPMSASRVSERLANAGPTAKADAADDGYGSCPLTSNQASLAGTSVHPFSSGRTSVVGCQTPRRLAERHRGEQSIAGKITGRIRARHTARSATGGE